MKFPLQTRQIDINRTADLRLLIQEHTIVLNCLDYSLNQKIIALCADLGVHYVDLGDNYDGIVSSHTYDGAFTDRKALACLGAGSAP